MKKFYQAIMLGGLALYVVPAPALADDPLRLHDAIQHTLHNNPQLAGYEFHVKALQGEQQTAALKPALHASMQFENVAGSGDFKGVEAGELTLSLSSIIELGGKNEARVGVVTARQQQAISSQRVLTLDILTQVTQHFIALAGAQEQLKLLQQTNSALQENVNSLNKQWDAGRTAEADLLRTKAALVKSTIDIQKKRREFDDARIKLITFWTNGSFSQPNFSQVEANLFSLPPLIPLHDLMHQLDNNPDIAALADQIQIRTAEVRLAQSEGATNINWNAGIRRLQAGDDSAIVIGMNVPLGSEKRAAGAIKTAIANQGSAELERNTARAKLQAHLTSLHNAYEQALAEVNSLRKDALPLLTQALRATQHGFNQGRYSYLELNLAQRELLEMQLTLIEAATWAHVLSSEIERLTATGMNKIVLLNAPARTLP